MPFAKKITSEPLPPAPPDNMPVYEDDWGRKYEPEPSLLDDAELPPPSPVQPEHVTPEPESEPEPAEPPRRPSAPPAPVQAPPPQPLAPSPRSSPRPAAARPVTSSYSPQPRPASLGTPPKHLAMPTTYRPYPGQTVGRRESSTSHTSPRPRFSEPVAPPHMPQPHFYGLPDLGLGFGQKKELAGKVAGSDGYCCRFDSFAELEMLILPRKRRARFWWVPRVDWKSTESYRTGLRLLDGLKGCEGV